MKRKGTPFVLAGGNESESASIGKIRPFENSGVGIIGSYQTLSTYFNETCSAEHGALVEA